ncbi:MAG: TolC family protein, partial [Deltaproteobacteria bacterium]|nr:TolC family protein [Deltaproteobacteria bacterium]
MRLFKITTILTILLASLNPLSSSAGETKNSSTAEFEGPKAPSATNKSHKILTLAQCIERAIKNSPKLQAESYRLVSLEESKKEALWEPFSHFSIKGVVTVVPDKCSESTWDGRLQSCDGGALPEDSYYKTTWGPSFHLEFKGGLPIPVSNKMSSGKEALDEGIKAKQSMMPSFKNEIRYNVHRAYYGIIGSREMLYTLSEGRKQLAKARQKIESNLENQEGNETEIDLIKLKVFEAQLDSMEQQAKQIETSALNALQFLVQAKQGEFVDIEDIPQTLVDSSIKNLEDYVQLAIDNRPELEALRHGIKAYKAKIKFEKSNLIPDLQFVISMRWGYTPGVDFRQNIGTEANPEYVHEVPYLYQNKYNYSSVAPGIGLVMNYPLDFGLDAHKIKRAKADLKAMMMDNTYAMKGIILQVQNVYANIDSLKKQITALENAKKLAKGWMAAAIQNQATGIG